MAGIIIGGEGGTGVLMACQLDRWSEPAFYTTVAGSTGLQFGAQTSEAVPVFMTDRLSSFEKKNKSKIVNVSELRSPFDDRDVAFTSNKDS